MDSIRDGYAFQASTNTLITGVQGEINNIFNTSEPLVITVEAHNIDIVSLQSQVSLLNSINYIQQIESKTYPELLELIEVARDTGYFNVFNNPILAGIGIDTVVGIAEGVVGSALYASYISEQAQFLYYSSNSNITSNQKDFLKSKYDEITVSSINSFGSNMRRLNDINGCINSNIITKQYIPSLRTNQITLNQTNISNIFVTSNVALNTSNILNNNIINSSNYLNLNSSNILFNTNYTVERPYPPKLFNSSTSQSVVTYLNQTPTYYETITLNTDNITYGNGTYEIRSSSIDDTSISFTGTGSSLNNVINDNNYSYIQFTSNGSLILNSNLICDILVVGGGGGAGFDGAGGGGGGQVLYYTNDSPSFKSGNSITLNAGSYNINIGLGGTGSITSPTINASQAQTINGTNGGTSSIVNASTSATIVSAKGGAGGGSRNNVGNGGDVVGAGGNGHANSGASQVSNNGGGSGGTNNGDNRGGGGGGGGTNKLGTSKNGLNNQPSISRAGNGGAGVDINIIGTSVGYGGGGGGGSWNYVGGLATHGGGSGNITNQNGNPQAGIANTTGGGGSGGNASTGNPSGMNGGSGVVIIRFLNPTITTKKNYSI